MGKNVIDSAVESGVKHIVHASLPYASELTQGKVPMISFDGNLSFNFASIHLLMHMLICI